MNKINSLEPDFKEQIETLLTIANNVTGRKWIITSGRRTIEEQNKLYAQGRTAEGKVVTNAKGGSSPHNFGYAADLAPLKRDGKEIDWEAQRAIWKLMADAAKEMGLTAGYYFHSIVDMPHVESDKWKQQQALWKEGKVVVA